MIYSGVSDRYKVYGYKQVSDKLCMTAYRLYTVHHIYIHTYVRTCCTYAHMHMHTTQPQTYTSIRNMHGIYHKCCIFCTVNGIRKLEAICKSLHRENLDQALVQYGCAKAVHSRSWIQKRENCYKQHPQNISPAKIKAYTVNKSHFDYPHFHLYFITTPFQPVKWSVGLGLSKVMYEVCIASRCHCT